MIHVSTRFPIGNSTKEVNKFVPISCQQIGHGNNVYVTSILLWFTPQLYPHSQDILAEDPTNHGAMFVPFVSGSNKTTASVATGHQEYHPIYASPCNVTNVTRRSHPFALCPIAFLAIPKSKYVISYLYYLIIFCSHKNPVKEAYISEICTSNVPWIIGRCLWAIACSNDSSRSSYVSRWTLLACYLWVGTIYCRLPRTGLFGRNSIRMVPKVCFWLILLLTLHWWTSVSTGAWTILKILTQWMYAHVLAPKLTF